MPPDLRDWTRIHPVITVVLALGGGAAIVALLALVLKWVPEWLSDDDLKDTVRAEDISRARTAVLASLAGMIAITGAIFTGLSYRLNRAGHVTERFTRAIDQLGNDSLDVRLGGIYALERLAKDSRHDHPQVMEVLTAYVREHAPWPPPKPPKTGEDAEDGNGGEDPEDGNGGDGVDRPPRPPTDVQAAMTVLARRRRSHDEPEATFDLTSTDLRGMLLQGPHAHLGIANLSDAHLERARLAFAHLEGAELSRTHLEGANLTAAHLTRAHLIRAHLEGAWLTSAHLEGADLSDAHLEGAYLTGAHLEGAYLIGTQLEGVNLEGINLEGAKWSGTTRWPAGFFPPPPDAETNT